MKTVHVFSIGLEIEICGISFFKILLDSIFNDLMTNIKLDVGINP